MQPALHSSTAQNSLSAGGILFERKLQNCRWCGAWICLSVCLCYEVNTAADNCGILGTQLALIPMMIKAQVISVDRGG